MSERIEYEEESVYGFLKKHVGREVTLMSMAGSARGTLSGVGDVFAHLAQSDGELLLYLDTIRGVKVHHIVQPESFAGPETPEAQKKRQAILESVETMGQTADHEYVQIPGKPKGYECGSCGKPEWEH